MIESPQTANVNLHICLSWQISAFFFFQSKPNWSNLYYHYSHIIHDSTYLQSNNAALKYKKENSSIAPSVWTLHTSS